MALGLGAAWLAGGMTGCLVRPAGKSAIQAGTAPRAVGPYSQAIRMGDVVYVSGQIALDPATGRLQEGDVKDQTRAALRHIDAILTAAGLNLEDVVQAQVFLADLNDFAAMNEAYAPYFKVPPARITIQAGRLPRDARVEIAVVAVHPARHAANP